MAAIVIRVRHHLCHAEIHQGSSPSCILKAPPSSSNQCLPWPVLPCSYFHRKRTALSNPYNIGLLPFINFLSPSSILEKSWRYPSSELPRPNRIIWERRADAQGRLVKEPRSRMPLVTSSSAVTDFSFSLLDESLSSLRYARRKNTRLSFLKNFEN